MDKNNYFMKKYNVKKISAHSYFQLLLMEFGI